MINTSTRRAAAPVAIALVAALVAGCGGSGEMSATTGQGMDGMPMSTGDQSMNMHGTGSGPSSQMQGMAPLAAGADGTSATADDGLTLKPSTITMKPGKPTAWTLRVLRRDGTPVTRFERDQTKLMHLIVVRDDFTGYQHVHPVLHPDGRFTITLTLPKPGTYRAIADFTTGGKRYPLGIDLSVPGASRIAPLPAPSSMTSLDGYTVMIAHGTLMSGKEAQLTFSVLRSGRPFTGLQPYLAAFGHLVALRKPDLLYSHVHPVTHDEKKGTISFAADFPSDGTYRLFLQFRAEGKVHTAPFTIDVMK